MKLLILFSVAVIAVAGAKHSGKAIHENHVYSRAVPYTKGLKSKLKTWAERFPSIKGLIESKTSTLPRTIQEVTNNGYSSYSQSASMQAVEGIDAENFDSFSNYLVDTLEITGGDRKSFLSSLELIQYADNTDWKLVDIIFSQKAGANCKYVCILGHRDLSQNTYDFMIADFKNSFTLAPNIVLIEERKSYLWGLAQRANIRVERIPANLKLADVELLKTFFNQAALARFAEMLDIKVPEFIHQAAFMEPISTLAMINAGLDIVPKIINIFKTTSTSTIIKDITGEGFSSYEQSARTQVIQGMNTDNVLNKLVPMLPRLLSLVNVTTVKDVLELAVFTEAYTWNDYKMVFNQDKFSSNKVQFADVVCANRGDDKFNIILVAVAQTFTLAPNVQYIENSKSYVGGIYSKTEIERKEYPRTLTEKDMEVLMGFFHITVFKRLAAQYGLAIPQLPPRPELKALAA